MNNLNHSRILAARLPVVMPFGNSRVHSANHSPAGTVENSVAGVNYFLERGTNLAESPAFTPLVTNLDGQSGTTKYSDTSALGAGPFFYRVGVGD